MTFLSVSVLTRGWEVSFLRLGSFIVLLVWWFGWLYLQVVLTAAWPLASVAIYYISLPRCVENRIIGRSLLDFLFWVALVLKLEHCLGDGVDRYKNLANSSLALLACQVQTDKYLQFVKHSCHEKAYNADLTYTAEVISHFELVSGSFSFCWLVISLKNILAV